ncbi:hypothetical protein [Cellulophaga sp. Z1A5H]|uniref:hypothetical protein n=1 Tax=Cellulophaga sp. Z1A5H TaxID=2687291 RepID=UPI0013FD6C77|nr:hypothetical protein [Cellulophaga sp. Z1A5H]
MKYVILFFFIVSCSAQKTNKSTMEHEQDLALILTDFYSNVPTPQILIIEEVSSLRAFFATVNKTRKPGLAFPTVDFSKERILIYACGAQYGTVIPQLSISKEDNDELVINCLFEQPLHTGAVVASPFAIYKIKRSPKHIRFTRTE